MDIIVRSKKQPAPIQRSSRDGELAGRTGSLHGVPSKKAQATLPDTFFSGQNMEILMDFISTLENFT
jgi:hypothetical protein